MKYVRLPTIIALGVTLAASIVSAQAPNCQNGARAAAQAALESAHNWSADEILLRRSLGFEPVTRAASDVVFPVVVVEAQRDWKAFLGPSMVSKHDALCLAGDSALAVDMYRLNRKAKKTSIVGLSMFGASIAFLVAAVVSNTDDACATGFESVCSGTTTAFATLAVVNFVGTWVPVGIALRARRAYAESTNGAYAARVFQQYNEALRVQVEIRRR